MSRNILAKHEGAPSTNSKLSSNNFRSSHKETKLGSTAARAEATKAQKIMAQLESLVSQRIYYNLDSPQSLAWVMLVLVVEPLQLLGLYYNQNLEDVISKDLLTLSY